MTRPGIRWLLLVCGLVGWHGHVQAQETAATCLEIQIPAERLKCYDRLFGDRGEATTQAPATSGRPSAAIEIEQIEEPGVRVESVEPATVREAERPAVARAEPPPPPAREPEPRRTREPERERTFFGDEKVNMTARLADIMAGEKQKMVFQLDNGQIWIQSNPRPLPFKIGDRVTIKNAMFGGYFMSSERGTNTRVRRIN